MMCCLNADVIERIEDALLESKPDATTIDRDQVMSEILNEVIPLHWCEFKKMIKKVAKKKAHSKTPFKFPSCVAH